MVLLLPFTLVAVALILGRALAAPIRHVDLFNIPGVSGRVQGLSTMEHNALNSTNLELMTFSRTLHNLTHTLAAESGTSKLPLDLKNNIGGKVNVYITGVDPSGQLVMVSKDGQFVYPKTDPSWNTPHPIEENIVIPLETAQGNTTRVVLPDFMSSGRIWFAREGELHFFTLYDAAGKPQLVEPSSANPEDPSADVDWGFVEFTNKKSGIYANLSYVNFIGLPASMTLTVGDRTDNVRGLKAAAIGPICESLKAQASNDKMPWDLLCQSHANGYLRIVSPQDYVKSNPNSPFETYWDDYVSNVWTHYNSSELIINTQNTTGDVKCRVSGDQLTCDGDNRAYTKPTTIDIFGCNSGPFAIHDGDNDIHRAIVPRFCAAFNRGTLLIPGGDQQPNGPSESAYYQQAPNNWYGKFVHAQETDSRGYAFAYDDVTPDGGVDASGRVTDANPTSLEIAVGA